MQFADLEAQIRLVMDFPKAGILFRDVMPLLQADYRATVNALAQLLSEAEWQQIDAVVGIEARGFLLASGLAYAQDKGLLVVRKPGKLPPPCFEQRYTLEYGQDALQIAAQLPPQRVLIVDDVLATGGTMRACCALCEKAGHTVSESMTLINLESLNNFCWQGRSVRALWGYR